MRITPLNILRYWKRLMFPPDTDQYRHNRMKLLADMPWEPWLHAGVWSSVILILLVGEKGVIPPVDGLDWYWIIFGLISPTVGFFSVWTLEHRTGIARYYALWGRMIADLGLATAILLYQLDRYLAHQEISFRYGVLPNVVLMLAMWFTLVLVVRDVRFIIATEELAAQLRKRNELCLAWLTDRGVDDR